MLQGLTAVDVQASPRATTDVRRGRLVAEPTTGNVAVGTVTGGSVAHRRTVVRSC
jgi:hypothetical protein